MANLTFQHPLLKSCNDEHMKKITCSLGKNHSTDSVTVSTQLFKRIIHKSPCFANACLVSISIGRGIQVFNNSHVKNVTKIICFLYF